MTCQKLSQKLTIACISLVQIYFNSYTIKKGI